MILLGIDPGTATTGWGVIEVRGNRPVHVGHGAILTPSDRAFPQRLDMIFTAVSGLIQQYRPAFLVIEQLFYAKNAKTAMAVSQARGVMLLAAARADLRVEELTPLQVKQTMTGYGQADKRQIQQMVRTLLALPDIPKPDDAADALAIALAAMPRLNFNERVNTAQGKKRDMIHPGMVGRRARGAR